MANESEKNGLPFELGVFDLDGTVLRRPRDHGQDQGRHGRAAAARGGSSWRRGGVSRERASTQGGLASQVKTP